MSEEKPQEFWLYADYDDPYDTGYSCFIEEQPNITYEIKIHVIEHSAYEKLWSLHLKRLEELGQQITEKEVMRARAEAAEAEIKSQKKHYEKMFDQTYSHDNYQVKITEFNNELTSRSESLKRTRQDWLDAMAKIAELEARCVKLLEAHQDQSDRWLDISKAQADKIDKLTDRIKALREALIIMQKTDGTMALHIIIDDVLAADNLMVMD